MEIKCDLVRGPVYLTGEDIECWVIIKNTSGRKFCHYTSSAITNPLNLGCSRQLNEITKYYTLDKTETLAWASVQLNCFCTVSDDKVTNIESRTRKIR